MSDEPTTAPDVLVRSATELAKVAYDDALRPVAKEVGRALGSIGKAVNIGLAPLHALVWGWERIEPWLIEQLEHIFKERNVSEDRIKSPSPDIAVPAIEALRYSSLRVNFAKLVATSMDSERSSEAHPAFVEILKQLVPDEAKILKIMPMQTNIVMGIADVLQSNNPKTQGLVLRNMCIFGAEANCEHPDDTPQYIDNLCRLGLLEIPSGYKMMADYYYDAIRAMPAVAKLLADKTSPYGNYSLHQKVMRVTGLGVAFMRACI